MFYFRTVYYYSPRHLSWFIPGTTVASAFSGLSFMSPPPNFFFCHLVFRLSVPVPLSRSPPSYPLCQVIQIATVNDFPPIFSFVNRRFIVLFSGHLQLSSRDGLTSSSFFFFEKKNQTRIRLTLRHRMCTLSDLQSSARTQRSRQAREGVRRVIGVCNRTMPCSRRDPWTRWRVADTPSRAFGRPHVLLACKDGWRGVELVGEDRERPR